MALDINDKPWYVAVLIGLVLGGVLYGAMHMYVFKEQRKEIAQLETSIAKLEREIEKGRAAQRDLPKLEEDIRNYELELDRLRQILPTKFETDRLIKKIRQLTERGQFKLVSFIPQPFRDQDFYLEWPMKVELEGTYHELGLFFDRLSRFSRIINVTELKIIPLKGRALDVGVYTIKASFTQQTFIYKESEPATAGESP